MGEWVRSWVSESEREWVSESTTEWVGACISVCVNAPVPCASQSVCPLCIDCCCRPGSLTPSSSNPLLGW